VGPVQKKKTTNTVRKVKRKQNGNQKLSEKVHEKKTGKRKKLFESVKLYLEGEQGGRASH